jgi:hypothetical protein
MYFPRRIPVFLMVRVIGTLYSPTCACSSTYKINRPRPPPPGDGESRRVMQDKDIPNFVERICTTPLTPPVTCWRDMYSIHIFLWQYIAYMHMHLLY